MLLHLMTMDGVDASMTWLLVCADVLAMRISNVCKGFGQPIMSFLPRAYQHIQASRSTEATELVYYFYVVSV